MSRIIGLVLAWLILLFPMYLFGSLVSGTWDVVNWLPGIRFVLGLLGVVAYIAILTFTMEDTDIKK